MSLLLGENWQRAKGQSKGVLLEQHFAQSLVAFLENEEAARAATPTKEEADFLARLTCTPRALPAPLA